MSTIKINELATTDIALTDFIAKADANGLMTKNTVSNLSAFFETVGEVGFKGSVLIADDPTEDGWYLAGEAGTFPNIGGLVALSESVTIFVISDSDTTYSKIDIPLSLPFDSVPTLGSTNAVESGGVASSLATKLDSSILNNINSNFYSVFNGTSSVVNLASDITLELDGDSIEFYVIVNEFDGGSFKGAGIIGQSGTSGSQIGFLTNGDFFIKNTSGVNLTTIGFNSAISVGEIVKVKLNWTSTNIDIYKNDVFQKSVTKGQVILSNIGNAYNFFSGQLKGFNIIANGITTSIPIPFDLDNAIDITLTNTSDGFLTTAQSVVLDTATNTALEVVAINETNTSITDFIPYTNFNGAGQSMSINNGGSLVFEDDGDYIEFDVRIDDLGSATDPLAMGIVGRNSDGNNVGFWSSGLLYIRKADNTWLSLNGFNSPISEGETFNIKLLWSTVDGIKTYKNNVFQKNITNGTIEIFDFGNGYNIGSGATFKGGVKNLKLRAKGVDYDIPILINYDGVTNNGATKEIQSTFLSPQELEQLNSNTNKNAYYELNITGSSTGDEKFIVYQKISDDKYIGIDLEHNVDASIQIDLWRIKQAFLYTYNGSGMIKDSTKEMLQGGESEFTYRGNDGAGTDNADFTGGLHGDEIQISANFYANGVEISDISSNIALTPCSDFYYTNKSNTKTFGTTNNEAEHYKITTFSNKGYNTKNVIKWLIVPNFSYWYHGISSVSKDTASQVHNEYLDSFVANSDNTFKLVNDELNEYYGSNESNGLSCFITSKLLKPVNENANCEIKVWDTTTYTKYYRTFTPASNPSIGDIYQSEMTVIFDNI